MKDPETAKQADLYKQYARQVELEISGNTIRAWLPDEVGNFDETIILREGKNLKGKEEQWLTDGNDDSIWSPGGPDNYTHVTDEGIEQIVRRYMQDSLMRYAYLHVPEE